MGLLCACLSHWVLFIVCVFVCACAGACACLHACVCARVAPVEEGEGVPLAGGERPERVDVPARPGALLVLGLRAGGRYGLSAGPKAATAGGCRAPLDYFGSKWLIRRASMGDAIGLSLSPRSAGGDAGLRAIAID